jgi:hypothetical protein
MPYLLSIRDPVPGKSDTLPDTEPRILSSLSIGKLAFDHVLLITWRGRFIAFPIWRGSTGLLVHGRAYLLQ